MLNQELVLRKNSASTALFPIFILFSVSLFSEPLSATPTLAQAIDSISRPSTTDLTQIIQTSDSVISAETRQIIAEYLREMDKSHLRYFETHKFKVIPNNDAFSQINQSALPIPKRTPLCEKTITYLMHLQIEMLDRVLTQQDDVSANSLRHKRSNVRLLKPEQRVFGDSRDLVVAAMIKALSDINALHIALNIPSDLEITYPSRIKTLAEIERFILVKAVAVLNNAQQLGAKE
jgi:hypothetical protein